MDWFHSNKMVVNPHKFRSNIVNKLGKFIYSYKLQIGNHEINSENSV